MGCKNSQINLDLCMNLNYSDYPHRRYNPLTDEWVLVSPQRASRPWKGKVEPAPEPIKPKYDPDCYLCPGNLRANGERNPNYESTFVFTNDFPALIPDVTLSKNISNSLIKSEVIRGTCRVICFSPRHDLTLAEMSEVGIQNVINVWIEQLKELSRDYRWVQIFENKGEIMGCSNPHPHCQIWATTSLPNEPFKEDKNQKLYFEDTKSVMLCDYVDLELKEGDRVIAENDDWVVLVPFWAIWPFETILAPKNHILRLSDLNSNEVVSLSKILKTLLVKYDSLFQTSFPYSMGWHNSPCGSENYDYWQLHAHFYPPLLRSSNVKKFMVGYEMLAEPQRDITPESSASKLRDTPSIHYKLR